MRYIDLFLSLRCASDVLEICAPIAGASKEITEAFTVTQRLRKIALKEPMQWNVIDLCAGNALSSVLSVMYLPIKHATAVDKKYRKRKWEKVRRFAYVEKDIFEKDIINMVNVETIITSIHPCKKAAMRVVEIYNESKAPYLIMLPCCVQKDVVKRERLPTVVREKFNTHEQWAYILASAIKDSEVNIMKDKYCLSPRNIVITASRKGERL